MTEWSRAEYLSPGENFITILDLGFTAWYELNRAMHVWDHFVFISNYAVCLFLIRNQIVQTYDLIKSLSFQWKKNSRITGILLYLKKIPWHFQLVPFRLPSKVSAFKIMLLPKQALFLLENDFVIIGLSSEIWVVFFFSFLCLSAVLFKTINMVLQK